MGRVFSTAAVSLVLLAQACCCLRSASTTQPRPAKVVDSHLAQLKALADGLAPGGDLRKVEPQWLALASVLSQMSADGVIEYRNQLLIPGWDIGDGSIELVWVNNYHPRVDVRDLNGDAQPDLMISARESGRYRSPYYFLIYLNTGERLCLALQCQTYIANAGADGKAGYALVWNNERGAYDFSTFSSTVVDFYAREFETQALVFTLGRDGRYQRSE